MVHPNQNFVRRNGVFQRRWEGVSVGLFRRLHTEVDEGFKQRLDLWTRYLRNATLKDQSDARAGCNLSPIWGHWSVIYLDVAQETMFRVGSAVKVQDEAISLELQRRDHNPIARSRGLPFLINQFSILCGAGSKLSVRLKRNAGANWKCAMGKALLGLKVANQFATAAFGELSLWQRYVGGCEVGGDVCGGGFFSDCEDLGVRRCEGYGQEACDEGRSVTGQCHGSTSDVQQFAPSLCF